MSAPLQEVFSAREYLETYYPASFDQKKFFSALAFVRDSMESTSTVDVSMLSEKTGLSTEEGENAAIFNFLRKVSCRLLEAFPTGQGTLLDVGGGPTLYQHIFLCLNVPCIIHAEYLRENRKEVLAYLNDEDGSYSWENYFSVIRKMLHDDRQYQKQLMHREYAELSEEAKHAKKIQDILKSSHNEAFEKHLKEVLGQRVVACDVFSSSLESPEESELSQLLVQCVPSGKPDIISSHFLVESATESVVKWHQGMINLLQKLAPGGFFIMTAIRHASWYRIGSERVPAVSVDEHLIKKLLEEHGMMIEYIETVTGSDQEHHGYDGMVFVLAQKMA